VNVLKKWLELNPYDFEDPGLAAAFEESMKLMEAEGGRAADFVRHLRDLKVKMFSFSFSNEYYAAEASEQSGSYSNTLFCTPRICTR
jgi:hypothetical protein